jgi:hypothetical protein
MRRKTGFIKFTIFHRKRFKLTSTIKIATSTNYQSGSAVGLQFSADSAFIWGVNSIARFTWRRIRSISQFKK